MIRAAPGAVPRAISITGYVIPWRNGEPVLLEMAGCNDYFLPVFSLPEKLRAAMSGIQYDSVKKIDNGLEFVDSLRNAVLDRPVRIAVDLRWEGGRNRFAEIIL